MVLISAEVDGAVLGVGLVIFSNAVRKRRITSRK